jgi:hypothetical protein
MIVLFSPFSVEGKMTPTKRFLFLLSCAFVVLLGGLAAFPAATQAQCSVQSNWATYTVVRGDTLYRIARRFNTTTAILARANCLANSNRIFVGQRLYVPSGGGVVTPPPLPGGDRPITFQYYAGGYMLWWAETGEIWVLTGQQNGTLTVYPARSYGGLPDNPVTEPTPPRSIRPIMGFGRVWGNFPTVRAQLGWGATAEQSFISHYAYNIAYRNFTFSIPGGKTLFSDGRIWYIYSDNPNTPPPPPPVTPAPNAEYYVQSTFQAFENGFMTWRSDTGEIDVYFGTNGGVAAGYLREYYGALPDNPFNNPPQGRVRPIMGFGKVWGNLSDVRTPLGWATAPEVGFTMRVRPIPGTTILQMTVPFGGQIRWISNDSNRFWGFTTEVLGSMSANAQAEAPTPEVPTLQAPTVEATAEAPPAEIPPTATLADVSTTTDAVYQSYEKGFMVWRADNGTVMVFPDGGETIYYSQGDYQGLPDNPVTDPVPDSFTLPINGFGRVWGNHADVRAAFGWALALEQSYQAVIYQVFSDDSTGATCLNLPDGRSVKTPHFINEQRTWIFVNAC